MNKQLAQRIVSAFTIVMMVLSMLPMPQVSAHPALPPVSPSFHNAAIGIAGTWTNLVHGSTAYDTSTPTYTIPAGSNRLLVVAIASAVTTPAIARTVTLTYGGQTLIPVDGDLASAYQQHTELYYLNEAGITTAISTTLSFAVTGGTTRVTDVFAAVFSGVDQSNPITDHKTYTSGTTTSSSAAYPTALTVNAGDQAVEIISSDRTGSTSPRTFTYNTNWPMATQQTWTTTDGVRDAIANRAVPGSNTTDTASMTFSGSSLVSMTGMSIHAFVGSGTTSLGNGTDPSPATIGPGTAAELDAFTLNTDTGTDAVTGATVTLGPTGAYAYIARVALTADGSSTPLCSATPSSNNVTITGCNLPVTSSSTQYNVWITPLSATTMPAVPGGTYTVTGTVTAISATNATNGTDSTSATLTIDNQSPSNPPTFSGTAGNGQVVLNWTNPSDPNSTDLSKLVVLRRTSAFPSSSIPTPIEGTTYTAGTVITNGSNTATVVFVGNASTVTWTDTGLTNLTTYYYRIFAADTYANYSSGGTSAGPYTPFYNPTTVGLPTAAATAHTSDSITVTMPYTDDFDGNNTKVTMSIVLKGSSG